MVSRSTSFATKQVREQQSVRMSQMTLQSVLTNRCRHQTSWQSTHLASFRTTPRRLH